MRINILFFILVIVFSNCGLQQEQCIILKSPDGLYELYFSAAEKIGYSVKYNNSQIILPSQLGFVFQDDPANSREYVIQNTVSKSIRNSWKPVYGEKAEYPDNYEEVFIELASKNGNQSHFNLRLRAYNEGVAFRYEFNGVGDEVTITDELTEFSIPEKGKTWASSRAQSEIIEMPIAQIDGEVERPLLIEIPDQGFVAIGEAGLIDFARMKLQLKANENFILKVALSSVVNLSKPLTTPWRFIMASKQAGKLLENNFLVLNLSEPNKIENTAWIKPGKVIREVTLTTQGGLACVDFAAKYNLQYVEFDAGWYGPENDTLSDATTITLDSKRSKGPLDLHKVIAYAKSKDIGIILYVNRRALEKQIDEILPLYQSWGIAGVKYGFVQVGSQHWTNWLHEAVRKAADHQLMVDIHDEYRPTGYSRTYPNLMTQEGIRGDEESPDNAMVIKTLFTRMLAGAGDHTNCYMASRVDEKMGSHASQMAKAICLYSPWQFLFWYDRPQGSPSRKGGAGGAEGFIPEVPDLEFYNQVPAVWDDTRVMEGYPGEFIVIARKSGNTWFVGCITGNEDKSIKIPLDFLDHGKKYNAQVFSDDLSVKTITKVKIEELEVDANSIFECEIKKLNGLAVIIQPE